MEYINTERRTTKKDLKRKRLYNKYKRGGSLRIRNDANIEKTNEYENDKNKRGGNNN
jgi:hypothetical protein